MGIDFSKFSKEVQAKIKAALEDKISPNKIDAAELRAMNLEKEIANQLMQELCGNSEYLGDGYVKMQNKNKTLVLLDKPENNSFIPLTSDSLDYYRTINNEVAQGLYNEGVLYLVDSKGHLLKDKFNNYITERLSFNSNTQEPDDVSGNFEVIENEPPERTNRRFAVALVRSMYNEVINELNVILSQMGVLDAGLWREMIGMGVQAIADLKSDQELITATTKKKIERIETERDNICNSLNELIDSPEEFKDKFYQLVGKDYKDRAIDELREIQHEQGEKDSKTKFKECVSRFEELYPDNNISLNIESWEDSVEFQKTVDEIANIVIMLVMTGGIGKIFQGSVQTLAKNILLAAAKGDKKAVFANFAKLAPEVQTVWKSLAKKEFGVAAAQITAPMAQSSLTMGTWEGAKSFLNNLTNAEEMTPDELLRRTLEGLKSGAEMGVIMGGLEVAAIAPAMTKLTPVLNKLTGAATEITAAMEKGNGVVSMEKIMETYTKANEALRGKIVKEGAHSLVALPVLTMGFTATDTFLHYNEAEFKQSLLDAATTDEEREAINNMTPVDLRIEFAKSDFINQVKGMATIEGVGIMFRRLQAGRIAAKSLETKTPDILGANLREVKENGKTSYEICTPEGEVLSVKNGNQTIARFSSIAEATAAYSAMCTNIYSQLIDSQVVGGKEGTKVGVRNNENKLKAATDIELEDIEKGIKLNLSDREVEIHRQNLIRIAKIDVDIAKALQKRNEYLYADFVADYIIEAAKIDKNLTIKFLNMTQKPNLKNRFTQKPEKLFYHLDNVLDAVKSAQTNFDLTMEIINFAREKNLSTNATIPHVLRLAMMDKDIAFKIYKENKKIDDGDAISYINSLKMNKELTLELLDMKDSVGNKLNATQINTIVYASKKDPNFMTNIHKQVLSKELKLSEYYDIAKAVSMLGGDFVYKTVEQLTNSQKRILLDEISSWKFATGRSKIIDKMFPCLPKESDSNAIVNLINRLTKELNSKPQQLPKNKIKEFSAYIETLYTNADTNAIKIIVEGFLPEYSKNADSEALSKSVSAIKRITNDKEFSTLSENDKKITMISSIVSNLKTKNETQVDVAEKAYKFALKLGLSENDSQKIYSIVKSSNLIERFMATNKELIAHSYKDKFDITQREDVFNQLAFQLKEGNTFNLAKFVYSSVEQKGLTRFLDKLLEQKINEMKADDFVLYQTPIEEYKSKAHKETIVRDGKIYDVMVVKSDEIENFYAIGHNTDGISGLKGDRPAQQKFAKLKALEDVTNDRAYCGFYIDGENICAIKDGFIFVVPNDKFYVATGHDIGSRGKSVSEIINEYFTENNVEASTHDYSGKQETKNDERKMVSKNLKEILGISDKEYTKRLDHIKTQLQGEPFTPQNVEAIDFEFAAAYREFLSRVNYDGTKGKEALLSDDEWNEVIVTNPKIGAIYTTKLAEISEDMLIFARDNNIPIVVLRKKSAQVTMDVVKQEATTPQHIIVGDKIFDLKSKKDALTSDAVNEVNSEIETIRQTDPNKAEELQIVLNMFTNPTEAKNVTDKQIDAVVNYLDEHYAHKKNYFTTQTKDLGLQMSGCRFSFRLKGLESTRDKVANYIADSIKDETKAKEKGEKFTPKTLLDAFNDVRDKYACRTVFKNRDFTKHPDVSKLIKEAEALKAQGKFEEAATKMHEAELKAAEIQSKPLFYELVSAMKKAKEGNADLSMMRISNYASPNGIPIFSELQLAELKRVGAKLGINVEFIKLAKDIDPKLSEEERKLQEKKLTTKSQPSGYTALQVNFVTKTGEVIEWQYRGDLVDRFAEAEHLPYDLRTGKNPWKHYPKLEPLYKTISNLLGEDVMPKEAYKQLNKYFTDYYTHLRRLELGFESKEPRLENYQRYVDEEGVTRKYKFDKRLEAKNLEILHNFIESAKQGGISPEAAMKAYENSVVKDNATAEKTNYVYASILPIPSERLINNVKYEFSRTYNRGKRAVTYVTAKATGFIKGTKKLIKGLSNLKDFAIMNAKLKRMGVKDARSRYDIEERLRNSNFESEEVRTQIIDSIKNLKNMKVRDTEIDNMFYHLEKVENGKRILDSTSLEIISEMEKLFDKVGSEWDERTFSSLTLDNISNGDNVELLNKIKDLNLLVDKGYTLDEAEYNLRLGIRGKENIELYEDILNSPITAAQGNGLGVEYAAKEIFRLCQNSQKEVIPENWELIQQFSKELFEVAPYLQRHYEIFKSIKNDDIEITKQNLKIFLDAYKADPASVKIRSLKSCLTKDGILDLTMMGDAEIASKLNVDAKDLKNPDGTYNQNAIKYIQALRDAGFSGNLSFGNIVSLAKSAAYKQKLAGEIYSKEIIDTAIELKEYGIHDDVVSHIIKMATKKGVIDKELLELYKPFGKVLKIEDMYALENQIGYLLTYGNSEYRPQMVSQMIELINKGLSLHEIEMSEIFTYEGALGNIVTPEAINALIKLKQNDVYALNLKDTLNTCRRPDGTINEDALKTFIELKKQGFDEYDANEIVKTAVNEKGEFSKDNLNITLQLMKDFKGSEMCRDNDEIYMAQLLIEMSSNKSGKINSRLLEENKKDIPDLYKILDEEDRTSFRFLLQNAVTPDGRFDRRIIERINELKNLDDGVGDPNYLNTIVNFLDACKDSEGNFSIEMYNDGVMLVKKHGLDKHQVSYMLSPYEDFKAYKNKNNIYDLSLQEKRRLQSLLLSYNSRTVVMKDMKEILKSDLIPTADIEYAKIMKQLSQSLGQTDFVLSDIELGQMNNDIAEVAQKLVSIEKVGDVKISKTYDELLKQIQSKMSGMSEFEKLKIYDYFGFTVKDGKISGFPSANGKSIENTDITNSFSKKVVEVVTKIVNDYNANTQIIVEGNPELSETLTSLSRAVPEILNKFSNATEAKQTIQTIQKMSKSPEFAKLKESDKNVLFVAALLKDTKVGSLRETAYHIHTMSSKFNWSRADRENLYNLLILPERIEEYNNSNPDKVISRYIRYTTIKSNEREEALDMLAFTIKDRSLDKMSYLLYSDEIPPELRSELTKRIFEIKKDDFILPQMPAEDIEKYAVEEEYKGHKVKVVHASKVPDLFAYVHTPEAGIINHVSRTTKLSNFEEFNNVDNDAVICASFVSSSQFSAFRKHGLVFKVPTGHEYVGMSYDMTSLGKNIREMLAEYYRNKGLKAGQGKGMKYSHRTFVSTKLKDSLHITEHSYSDLLNLRQNLMVQIRGIEDKNSSEYQNIKNQIVQINKEIKKIDNDYVARMDRVKEQCSAEQISLSDIRKVDLVLAKAYEEFLSKTNSDYKKDALMRKDYWNEVLVSGMTVSGEYTVDIDNMPEEYLIKSETEGTYIIDFSR